MGEFTVWREVTIPAHAGGEDLIRMVRASDMHVECWAESLLQAACIAPRSSASIIHVLRLSNLDLGFKTPLVSILKTKEVGRARGLRLLSPEEVLALRLSYADQSLEWMRVAVETYADEDGSCLDLALVNDGSRRDIRTTWGFGDNVYQSAHEWFWVLPE